MDPAPVLDTNLNPEILEFGRSIFNTLGLEQPSAFRKGYWINQIMKWSLKKPSFKVNMFRLVDVLPVLRNSAAIVKHVQEYLSGEDVDLGRIIKWGLKAPANSFRAQLLSLMVKKGVREMASIFIAGENPQKALPSLKRLRKDGFAFTVDLLGEFSVSEKEAKVYLDRYLEALHVFGEKMPGWEESEPIVQSHPGETTPICLSIKLTALYSQCSPLNFERSIEVLSFKLSEITREAKNTGALLYVDAEDCSNNPIIYATFKKVFGSQEFLDFPYPGIVVQAYAKNSGEIIADLLTFAKKRNAPIAVRLVKGAYWDFETITSAQNDWPSPLFSQKRSSDAQYEHLSRVLIDNHRYCLPAFGSHNIRGLSHACCYARYKGLCSRDFELQMLYGMAEPIAQAFKQKGYLVRFYVPLGNMIVGMGYLVRRLLENSSNESFLKHTFFDATHYDELLSEPIMGD